ncbi:polygalacturonase [Diabrotica virgifera virgifera]|uniref:Glycoside hydrolase family 28 n=1 Tax=Diabrotica virgifera virgifera TaxID=50390 RepID=A0A088BZ12_DIAVI|nr:polygalacturonase [Diabrotica virgifera virgifera]AHJ09938.1 glycoside hydrolase family 28 [Diabrotica virgifera virgifera]
MGFSVLLFLSLLALISGTSVLQATNNTEAVGDSCTITQYSQVDGVLKSCTNIILSNVEVPSGKSLNLYLRDGSTLTVRGTISFDVGYNNIWLVTISGNNIKVIGEKGSLFHGHGEKYWDGHGGSGGVTKPKLLQILNVNNAHFSNINLKNCPMFCTGITKAKDLTIDGWNADCAEGDKLGRNTDGIGISWSQHVYINNAYIHNQDQCLYVNQGSDMVFTGIHCVGSNGICATAGFSKTSYEENTTKNITFHNCVLEGGLTGVQVIAMADGGPGEITDIHFQSIILKGVRQQGVYVQMDYGNDGHPNNNIAVTGLKLSHVTGTVSGNSARPYYIKCGAKCSNWIFNDVQVTGGGVKSSCNYKPSGFNC